MYPLAQAFAKSHYCKRQTPPDVPPQAARQQIKTADPTGRSAAPLFRRHSRQIAAGDPPHSAAYCHISPNLCAFLPLRFIITPQWSCAQQRIVSLRLCSLAPLL